MDNSKKKINQIADQHIELGMLLRRKRRKKDREAVEKIMGSNLSINEKISDIKKIDRNLSGKESLSGTDTPNRDFSFEVYKNQEKIKANVKKSTFFNFIFLDSIKIKKFGKESHVLLSGLMPFNIRINPDVRRFFNTYFQKYVTELLDPLKYALSTGWQYLKKLEYNLLVVLKRFCETVLATNFLALNCSNKNLIEKLQGLERLFLVLHYNPKNIDALTASFKAVLLYNNYRDEEQKGLILTLEKVITRNGTLPSFYNFILGLNMLRYRRYMNLRTLFKKDIGNVVLSDDFDCDDDVREKIMKYIEGIEQNLLPVIEQERDLVEVKAYTSKEDSNETDYAQLSFFYDSTNREPGHSFSRDKENIILFLTNLLKGFIDTFGGILNGTVLLVDNKKSEIFSQTFFKTEIIRLEYYYKKLAQLMLDFNDLPVKRFNMIKSSQRGALDAESEVIKIADEVAKLFAEIGKKLASVLKMSGSPEAIRRDNVPLNPTMLEGKPVKVPYAQERVLNPDLPLLSGKCIIDILKQVTSLSFLTGIYLNNEHLIYLLRNEKSIHDTIRSKMEILERMASSDALAEFKKIRLGQESGE
ncbi:MAG: hypothetical protein JW969_15480 [Spirochaetales bacterium]|nr:hypothetical protein [Spirochaetales bacterium]